jgi:hypothetical protein
VIIVGATGLLGLIWLIVVIWAIIKVADSAASSLSKAIWIVVVLAFPFLGLILWFLFGPKSNT